MDSMTCLFNGFCVVENNMWELTDFFHNGFQLTLVSHKEVF